MKKGISFLVCKITLLVMIFSFCSIALAGGPEVAPPPSYDGFFILGGAGGELIRPVNLSYRQRNVAGGAISEAFIKVGSRREWNMAPFMKVGLEWAHVFPTYSPDAGMYLGLNVNFLTGAKWHDQNARFFGLFNAALGAATGYTDLTIRENYLLDGLFKIGYAWQKYLVFVQLGAGAGDLSFVNRSFSSLVAGFQVDPNKWAPAYLFGLGFEALLNPKLIFGVDYLYTRYTYISVLGAMDSVGPGVAPAATQGIFNAALQTHRVSVYLKYKLAL